MSEQVTIARPVRRSGVCARARAERAAVSGRRCSRSRATSRAIPRCAPRSTIQGSTSAAKESLLLSLCGDALSAEGKSFIRVLIEADRIGAVAGHPSACSTR